MRQLRALIQRLRGLFSSRSADSDFGAELESHIAFDIDAGIHSGLSREEARRQALIRLGGAEQTRQAYRERQTLPWVEGLIQDLRYGLRMMARKAGFTTIAVLTLAIGIGASTAIFSAIKPILIDALPYPHASRLTMLWEMRTNGAPMPVTFGSFHGVAEQSHMFDALAVYKPWQPAATGASQADRPERLLGQRVSAEFFRTLGIAPQLGRDFQAADDRYRGPNVAVISDALWRRRFGGDPAIVGKQIRLNGNLYDVIAVMPPSFEDVLDPAAEIWAPLQYDPSLPWDGREWGHHLRMIGRLKAGVTEEQAGSEISVILHGLATQYAKGYNSSGGAPDSIVVHSMQHDLTQAVRPALLAVLGAVLLLLLIACVNVANLLLARGAQRRAEFAVRAALGAPQGRLTRQLLTESILLAGLGGMFGMLVAEAGERAIVILSPPGLPRLNAVTLDGRVFLFALALTTLIGIVVGFISNWQVGRSDFESGMRQRSSRTTDGHGHVRRLLVIAEVSIAVVLLVSAGLLLRSMQRLFAVDPGFDSSHLLTMRMQDSGSRDVSDALRLQSLQQTLERVQRVPGVVSAGLTSQLPLGGDQDIYGIQFEKDNKPVGDAGYRYAVTPGYFAAMQIPLRRGRLLDDHDTVGGPVAVLISQSLADREFGAQDPIGQHVRLGPEAGRSDKPWATIVGVVGNVKQESLAITQQDAFYTTTAQWAFGDDILSIANIQSIAIRTRGDVPPASLAPAIQQAIWSVDRDRVISRIATMESLVAATEVERRFVLVLFEAFGMVALVLAAIGIYGVLSGSVTERTREIGVRTALGATRTDILTLILRQGMTMTCIGLAIGLCFGLVAARALAAMLYGISWLDGGTWLGATLLLFAVAGFACLIPARRAASIDPMQALRTE